MRVRGLILIAAVLAALGGAACGDPPEKEMQQAQTAIDQARSAGAAQYAHDEFAAAEEALKNANDAVVQRDYRQALNRALEAREHAQAAEKQAVERKTTARKDADRAIGAATRALDEARARLTAAETARVPPRALAASRRNIASVDKSVQKARTAYERGDYTTAVQATSGTTDRLREVAKDLEAATGKVKRRGR